MSIFSGIIRYAKEKAPEVLNSLMESRGNPLIGVGLPDYLKYIPNEAYSAISPLETLVDMIVSKEGGGIRGAISRGGDLPRALESRGMPKAGAIPLGLLASVVLPGAGELKTLSKLDDVGDVNKAIKSAKSIPIQPKGVGDTITLYRAAPKFPSDKFNKGTYFADDVQKASYYSASHYKGNPSDIKVQQFTLPKDAVFREPSTGNYVLKGEVPVTQPKGVGLYDSSLKEVKFPKDFEFSSPGASKYYYGNPTQKLLEAKPSGDLVMPKGSVIHRGEYSGEKVAGNWFTADRGTAESYAMTEGGVVRSFDVSGKKFANVSKYLEDPGSITELSQKEISDLATRAVKDRYDGLYSNETQAFFLPNKSQIKTSLPTQPKGVEPLIQEARKYKSAEEFINNYQKEKQLFISQKSEEAMVFQRRYQSKTSAARKKAYDIAEMEWENKTKELYGNKLDIYNEKSQLTDIWNKANKVEPIKIKK